MATFMRFRAQRRSRQCAVAVAVVGAVLAWAASARAEVVVPGAPDDLERLIARIAASQARPTDGVFRLADAPDASAPSSVLRSVLDGLDRLGANVSVPVSRQHLALARRSVAEALARLEATSPDLAGVPDSIRAALLELGRLRVSVRPLDAVLDALSKQLGGVARTLATRMLATATHGSTDRVALVRARASLALGDQLLSNGQYFLAVWLYDQSLGFAANTITFDIDLFEQNIRGFLAGQTVGHAYAIVRNGVLYTTGHDGAARTDADPTAMDQSPTKEMFIASHSKTVSALALLKLLHEQGISVEESIAGYLPSDWAPGPNVDDVTFRRLLTHRSGIDPGGDMSMSCCSAAGQSLAALQSYVEAGSTGSSDAQPSIYTNANFSLLRVLIPQIAVGEDVIAAYANVYPLDAVYAGIYADFVRQNVFEPAGIDATLCMPDESEDTRTLLYAFPYVAGTHGIDADDWSLYCGAAGWYLSAVELARLLAFVRFTDDIIAAETREQMDDLYLGWLDPTAFAAYVSGTFGLYRAHGGDYVNMTGCAMNFPITVQASLLINSDGGNVQGHPCKLLKLAFDAAWVGP